MYRAARQYGMNNISVDLIYGIPGQSLQDWKGELAELVILNPEHISVYGLTIEEHTPFANNKIAVNDDLLADMYEHAIDYLANSGYEHYEISNFSKRTEGKSFQCLHNRIYWKNEQYIGLGTSAVSYLNNERTKNLNAISKYCDKLNAGQLPVQEKDVLTIPAKESETIILGLRLVNDGINLTDSQVNRFNDRINELVNDGLLIQSGTNIRLTKKGILLSNHVFRAFL
jgi:oxygen-independent coproporphyrinogen-3 oxidase